MTEYQFYMEFDGKKTVSQDYRKPDETILEETIQGAGNRFAKRKKLAFTDFDVLTGNQGYRLFFENKRYELIYFVT